MHRYERLEEILVYENRRVSVFNDSVLRPDGKADTYFRVRYNNGTSGAVIIPALPDGRLLILNIRRYAFDEDSMEFPRGGSRKEEAPAETARRELLAETSLDSNSLIEIGHCRPDTSILQVDAAVYLAKLEAAAEQMVKIESAEAINGYRWVTVQELFHAAGDSKIRDGFTLSALALYTAWQQQLP